MRLKTYPKRIIEIEKLIDKKSKGVYDVGADHGYLLLTLKNNLYNGNLCGCENKVGPYKNLVNNCSHQGVKLVFCDGLKELNTNYDTLVFAGMGYDNIYEIINKDIEKIKYIKQIVVDSHTKIYEVRKFIVSLGFYINNEVIIKEDNIFYELISFKKGFFQYNEKELKYGPILINKKDYLFIEKYDLINIKLKKILREIKNIDQEKYIHYLRELTENLEVIKNGN